MLVRQIITPIEKYFIYKTRIKKYREALRWELIGTGESEKTEYYRKQIAVYEDNIGKLLDMEV